MQKQWPFVMLGGGTLVALALVVGFVDLGCGSALAHHQNCSSLVAWALVWFGILLVLGIATVIAGFMLRSRHNSGG